MPPMPSLPVGPSPATAAHFDAASDDWRDVNVADTLEGVIYRTRMEAALAYGPPARPRMPRDVQRS